jgi:alkylation response protein AidB-like acyl-CoA dehydrogenase
MSRPDGAGAGQVARSVSLAKALASDAALRAARTALQCHGAMGYTDDYHLHMWLKRVWCLAPSFGSARRHRRLVGEQLGVNR